METLDKIKNMINDVMHIEEDKINADSNLFDDLGFDSIEAFELVAAVEEEFGISISDEDAQNLKTVGDIVNYIENNK